MTNFELKLIEFLDEDAVELLWKQAVKDAKESGDDDLREYARNDFIDLLSDYLYDEVQKFGDDIKRELIEAALDDADIESIADYIIVNKNFTI
jgi:hypothetical protein